jgi:hypothetical protein
MGLGISMPTFRNFGAHMITLGLQAKVDETFV